MSGNALIGRAGIRLWSLSDTCRIPVGYLSDTCRILVKSYLNTCELGSLSDTCRIPVGYLSDTCYKWTKHHKQGIIKCHVTSQTYKCHIISHYHIISHSAGNIPQDSPTTERDPPRSSLLTGSKL